MISNSCSIHFYILKSPLFCHHLLTELSIFYFFAFTFEVLHVRDYGTCNAFRDLTGIIMRSQLNQFIKVCLIKYFITDTFGWLRNLFCASPATTISPSWPSPAAEPLQFFGATMSLPKKNSKKLNGNQMNPVVSI